MRLGVIKGFVIYSSNSGIFSAIKENIKYHADSIKELDKSIGGVISREVAEKFYKICKLHDPLSVNYFMKRK